MIKVFLDQGPDTARTVVIGVIEPSGQNIGPHHHPPFNLSTKSFGTRFFIHLSDTIASLKLGAVAKAHAIIACKVGRGFSWCNHVIGRKGVFGMWQANVSHSRTGIPQHRRAFRPKIL